VQSVRAPSAEIAALEGPLVARWAYHLVLPRILRKPVRMLRRVKLPRYIGIKGMTALFALTVVAGTVIGGHSMTVVAALTSWGGLAIENVQITGQTEISEVDVLNALAIDDFPSLVTFDVDAARARVESLPWVKQASIKKLYPDTLQVSVAERTPFAIWQHDNAVSLVDRDGRVIVDDVGDRYSGLPFVAGDGAAARAGEFADLIAGVPSLKSRIHAGMLVSQRRWSLVLDNSIEIMLPEDDPEGALVAVAALDEQSGLLSRDIAAVDLRNPDRLVVRLTDSGISTRNSALKEREKLAQKARANT